MDKKYRLGTAENAEFMKKIREDLFNFGQKFPSPEGGAYYLGDDGTPWTDRDRQTWITARMAHVYSIGYFLKHKNSGELAAAAINGLRSELHDDENGGWYAGIGADGKAYGPKQCYAHAFVILAASSALLADIPGAKELLAEAEEIYDKYFWNEDEGLSADGWDTEFKVLDSYRGLNANMHTVEAFLADADVTGNEKYRIRAGRIIDRVLVWARDNNWRIPEHYSDSWVPDLEYNADKKSDPFKPYGATPGHGIEWARLIVEWAVSTFHGSNEQLPYIEAAENLYKRAIKDAWNADGEPGICYTTDWNGKPIVHDRMHWTLAEAINTSSVLFNITKNNEYAEDYEKFLSYLDSRVLDHVNGSWFHQLDQHNNLLTTVWPGKSDLYHAVQATLIPFYRADISIASAVKMGEE